LALEHVVIAFRRVIASWASRIVTSGSLVKCFACRELPETELDIEGSVPVAGAEGTGKGIPGNRFSDVIFPVEAVIHILFDQPEAVLASDSGSKFSGNSSAADGELDTSCGEERYEGACHGVIGKFVCG
jgi:hypothetical protein